MSSSLILLNLLLLISFQEPASHPGDDPNSLVKHMGLSIQVRDLEPQMEVEIVQALTIAGETEQALKRVQSSDFLLPETALRRIVKALGEHEDLHPLLEVARKIEDPGDRTTALTVIADAYVERNERKTALKILAEAERSNREVEHLSIAAYNLIEIAQTLVKAQENKRALEVLNRADEQTRKLGGHLQSDRGPAIAKLTADAGDQEAALRILDETAIHAEAAKGPESFQAYALKEIAIKLAEISEVEKSLAFTADIDRLDLKAGALAGIAAVLLQVGRKEQALKLLDSSVRINEQDQFPYSQVEVNCEIAMAYGLAGEKNRVRDVLERAMKLVDETENRIDRVMLLQLVGDTSIKLDELELARSALQTAAESAVAIDDPPNKAGELLNIISLLILAGQPEIAQTLLKPAIEATHQSGGEFLPEYQRAISTLWARLNNPEQSIAVIRSISLENVRTETLWDLTVILAFEGGDKFVIVQTNQYRKDRLANQRLKKTFTKEEQELARKIIEALPKQKPVK